MHSGGRGKPEADRFWNFPIAAIEEALGNAIYHRSYEERESVEVRITPEELLVLSFPGPDRSIRMEDLQQGRAVSRRYRNRRIGEFLKELARRGPLNRRAVNPASNAQQRLTGTTVRDRRRPHIAPRPPSGPHGVFATEKEGTEQDTEQVTEQVEHLVLGLTQEMPRHELQKLARISHRPHFLETCLNPALEAGLIEMTLPDRPTSRNQRYRRTPAGEALAHQLKESRR